MDMMIMMINFFYLFNAKRCQYCQTQWPSSSLIYTVFKYSL